MDLVDRFILNIFGSLFIIFNLVIFNGCANKDIARKAYLEGNYKKAYSIWKRWADAGYYDAYVKLLQIMRETGEKIDYQKIKQMALKAYNHGEKKAAFFLEDIYIHEGNLKEAYLWMTKGDFSLSSAYDLRNHLYIIENYNLPLSEKKIYLNKIEELAENNNADAAVVLGDFYSNRQNPFYDLRKSEYFYKKAYKSGKIRAGISLARLYLYQLNKEKEGLGILKYLSDKGNCKASYEIGDFMLYKMNILLPKKFSSCIATSFQHPHEFFINKKYAEKFKKVYLSKKVIPWYKKAYKQGCLDSMFKLISLDIQEDNFNKSQNFSQMSLKQVEEFLKKHKQNKKALKLLVKLYRKYPTLEDFKTRESLLLDYMEINPTEAMWNLYDLYKKNNMQKAKIYLQELVIRGFKPAIIEQSYQNVLNHIDVDKNIKLLINEAKAGNEYALQAIASLYNKSIIPNIDLFPYLEDLCKRNPTNKSVDMKIADYYLKNNNISKGAIILYYYAQSDDNVAQYKLYKLYNRLNIKDKEIYWLKKAKDNGNIEAKIDYSIYVLKGIIKDDISQSLQILNNYAKKGNIKALRALAEAYSTGITVNFDPQMAISYYILLIKKGYLNAYMDLISLYQKINIDHRYDSIIEQLYKQAIRNKVPHAKVKYAEFLINRERIKEAKKILFNIPLEKEPLAKVLLYKITGNKYYIYKGKLTNNGKLLLTYAEILSKYSKRKALLYAFRAHLCNTPSSGKLTYDLIRLIHNSNIVKKIYQKAKTYPKCSNY